MNAAQLRLAKDLYNGIYYLANREKWTKVYAENRRRVLGVHKKRRYFGRRRWHPEELRVLRRLYPLNDSQWVADQLDRSVGQVYAMATELRIAKAPSYRAELSAKVARKLQESGKAHRFPKGHVPANKGLRRPGWSPGRMKETQFKPGQKIYNQMAVGSERLIDGCRWVKVAEVPRVAYTVNWKAVHVLEWERENGRPVPDGHCLWFRDRNRLNVSLDNLELITRAENLQRNARKSWRTYPPELRASIIQLGKLRRRIDEKQNGRSARSPVRDNRRSARQG